MRAKYRTTIVRLAGELRADRSPAEPQVRSRPSRNRQPNQTRDALLEAAARIFNSAGYHGTDSNRIAREAGYAPGTFYVHFADKLAIFLEVYEGWVSTEWTSVEAILKSGGTARELRKRLSRAVLEHHRKWRTFRASLRALSATDRSRACGPGSVARASDRNHDPAAAHTRRAGAGPGADARAVADS